MVPGSARRDQWGAYEIIGIFVTIGTAADGNLSRQALTQATTSLRRTTISALLTMEQPSPTPAKPPLAAITPAPRHALTAARSSRD